MDKSKLKGFGLGVILCIAFGLVVAGVQGGSIEHEWFWTPYITVNDTLQLNDSGTIQWNNSTQTVATESVGLYEFQETGESWVADIGNYIQLDYDDFVSGTETVYNSSMTIQQSGNYTMNYMDGSIKADSGSVFVDGASYSIDYNYTERAKVINVEEW